MMLPAVSSGSVMSSQIFATVWPFCWASTNIETSVPASSATFLLPMNSKNAKAESNDSLPPKNFTKPALPFPMTMNDARLMSAMGRMTGAMDQAKDGNSDSGLATAARRSASAVPGVSRIGTSKWALSHLQTNQPTARGTRATRIPARMDTPTSIFRFSTIAMGPG